MVILEESGKQQLTEEAGVITINKSERCDFQVDLGSLQHVFHLQYFEFKCCVFRAMPEGPQTYPSSHCKNSPVITTVLAPCQVSSLGFKV